MADVQVVFTQVGQRTQIDLDRPRPQVGSDGTPDRSSTEPASSSTRTA